MVCLRCVIVVKSILADLHIDYTSVDIGYIKLHKPVSDMMLRKLQQKLAGCELSLTSDRKCILSEEIKTLITKRLRESQIPTDFRFPDFLSRKLFYDYTYLANIFSEVNGSTIERFYIESRISRVKELINAHELTITEIARALNFSSVPHLCGQFKKITGITTAKFKSGAPITPLNTLVTHSIP